MDAYAAGGHVAVALLEVSILGVIASLEGKKRKGKFDDKLSGLH